MGTSKGTYLAKNIGLLTVSQFGTKLLSFFLVPLYTNILTTSEYGTYDLLNTTVSLLIPILTLNISESVMRFALDQNADQRAIFSIGCRFLIFSNIILIAMVIVNHIFGIIPMVDEYSIYFVLLFFVQSTVGIMTSFVRGIDRIADLSVSGVVCSFSIIVLNILFLCVWRMGIDGYFLANILGTFAQVMYLFFRTHAWRYWTFTTADLAEKKKMIQYCVPLIANSTAWWVNSVSDRYVVTWFCGVEVNGIYSVASKIPSILNIVQSIFNQAWTLSAVKDFDSKDESGFFSNLYNSYNALMVLSCSGLIVINRFLASILYAKDFYSAWQYVPFLMIAIVFGAMSGYIGGIFSAVKNSKIFAQSTVIGAIANLIMNCISVPIVGAVGAAIATAISYCFVYVIRLINMKKYMTMKLYLSRDMLSYGLLMVQSFLFLALRNENWTLYGVQIVIFIFQIVLYKREIRNVWNRCLGILKHKSKGR